MDTAKPIPINIVENSEDLHLANLTDSECSLINNYVLLTRDVIEANQLFESALRKNLCKFKNCDKKRYMGAAWMISRSDFYSIQWIL